MTEKLGIIGMLCMSFGLGAATNPGWGLFLAGCFLCLMSYAIHHEETKDD
jgi:protein-S-isoprenylcysteine O-methyltransferase Ste14